MREWTLLPVAFVFVLALPAVFVDLFKAASPRIDTIERAACRAPDDWSGCETTLTRAAIKASIAEAADKAGVPVNIALALVETESFFQPSLRGTSGEYGLGQVMCETARDLGLRGSCRQLSDIAINLEYSMRYLKMAIDKGGVTCAGVTLYNVGVNRKPFCSAYGRRVMAKVKA